jgi:hypothetical protein
MHRTKTAKVSTHRLDTRREQDPERAQTETSLVPPMLVPANVVAPRTLNNSSSWGGIPSDVLLDIASYLRDDRYALFVLTRVCAYWREVLIECPLNWTQVSTEYPRKIFKLWLQRSKNVPIDVEICTLPPQL